MPPDPNAPAPGGGLPAGDGAAAAAPAPGAAAAIPAAAPGPAVEPVAAAPAPAAVAPAAAAAGDKPATPPANEFAPSLLDAAAPPPAKDGEKPAGDKPADPKAAEPAKAGEAKPGEAAKPAEPGKEGAPAEPAPAPIEYALAFPEGVKSDSIDKARLDAFTGTLNEARVAPEIAQKFLDLHLSEMGEATRRLAQNQWDVFNNQQNAWREQVMADEVLGGARHGTAMKTIMGFVDRYAGDAGRRARLLDAFRMTGIANNPDFLHVLHDAGQDLVREAEPHPAPPPRAATPNREQRGLNRYRGTTPAR